jgi:hypothetical protein
LLLSAFPELTVSDVEAALIDTAVDLGDIGPDNDYGFGMIDAMAAYRLLVPCTDADNDGYYVETVCGTAQDCNDNGITVYPGASEVKHDGIDQDCDGYDLTIDILSAVYYAATDELEVLATSALAEGANLQLVGFGPMGWNPDQQRWEITAASVGEDPGTVAVSGVEGTENAPTAPCTDSDVDGYYIAAVCGTELDCNDNDITIYPGASEVKHDGIDQDCNGYDLTIEILSAEYLENNDTLCATAISDLGEGAGLALIGYGPMTWDLDLQSWVITVVSAAGNPGAVTVSGIEGSDTSDTTTICTDPCEGDFDVDGDVDGSDLSVFAADFGRTDCNADCEGDFDVDGDVDGSDLSVIAADFGRTNCPQCVCTPQ